MFLISTLYKTVLDALFPLSGAELELLKFSPLEAWNTLAKAVTPPTPATTAIFAYKDERVSKLIWNIKYKKSATAVAIGGYSLHKKLQEMNLARGTVLIPIPITPRRRKERGYNQCELLLDEIAQLDTAKQFAIEKHLLIRTQHSERQTLKGRADRLEDAKGIFSVNEELVTDYKERPIVIIDDVITTGSTISEAIATVKKSAGVDNVQGLSLAH